MRPSTGRTTEHSECVGAVDPINPQESTIGPAAPIPVAIALGSSLDSPMGDRASHIRAGFKALAALPHTRVIAHSNLHHTDAVTPPGTPAGPPYLNAAMTLETTLAPRELLHAMLDIERRRGRDRAREGRWGPRTLDLDLLLYGHLVIDEPGLTVPHPRMLDRTFVLEPLAEIAADWVIPGLGRQRPVDHWLEHLRAVSRASPDPHST